MNILDGWTQFGIAGVMLAIFFYIVKDNAAKMRERDKENIEALKERDKQNIELTERFIKIAEDNVTERINLKNAIDANTQATKKTTDILTTLVMKIIKEK